MRTPLLYSALALVYGLASAQAQNGPPPVIRVYEESLKPGKNAAHEKAESAYVHAYAKANFPAHYIALDSMAGPSEAWFVEGHASFDAVEKAEKAGDAAPLKAEVDQATAIDGEYLTGMRALIGVYRGDLSYDPEGSPSLSKTRYMNVITVRIKMGTENRLSTAVTDLIKIYKNVAMPQATLVYQMISGAPSGTYLIFEPMTSLSDWDKYPTIMQSIRDTSRGKFDAVERAFAEITTLYEGRLFSINPRMSYVSKETVTGDPDFWAPKPKAAPPAKKGATPRQAGQ
jgi:hypothetical protein